MNKPDSEHDQLTERVTNTLNKSLGEFDDATLKKLQEARQKAVQQPPFNYYKPGLAVAASLLMVLAISPWFNGELPTDSVIDESLVYIEVEPDMLASLDMLETMEMLEVLGEVVDAG